ncbi:hypothetical protein niasHT_024476 [Heterodera trifolii]|uniref:Uncharacterized protein n=1 Tax=Heterodera trifolii TaxID=157864 RepID=A0ABD2K749_9BILA
MPFYLPFFVLFSHSIFHCFAQFAAAPFQFDNLISNVGPSGDVPIVPNLYRWIEQNAHICESSPDGPVFLTELEAEQNKCLALCGDWESGKACAKRGGEAFGGEGQTANCQKVPELCLQNFQQEFFPLRFSPRDEFLTTTIKASSPSRHGMELLLVDSDLTIVDGEVTSTAAEALAVGGNAANAVPSVAAVVVPSSPSPLDADVVFESPAFPSPSPLLPCPAFDVDVVSCAWWKRVGECTRNARFMQRVCRRTEAQQLLTCSSQLLHSAEQKFRIGFYIKGGAFPSISFHFSIKTTSNNVLKKVNNAALSLHCCCARSRNLRFEGDVGPSLDHQAKDDKKEEKEEEKLEKKEDFSLFISVLVAAPPPPAPAAAAAGKKEKRNKRAGRSGGGSGRKDKQEEGRAQHAQDEGEEGREEGSRRPPPQPLVTVVVHYSTNR